nr:RNA polymerase factor sigma-54 [uncultured Anaerostipes sp.]
MSLTFTIEQKQTISQGLIHMVNLLQMNRQDLLVYLEEQSMENPLLEVDDAIYSYMPSESEENWIEQLEGRKESLRDDLMEQLMLESHDPEEMRVLENMIYSLDENGFLREAAPEIAKRCETTEKMVQTCRKKIQDLEPAGIGAGNLKECLMIQLRRLPRRNPAAEEIVENYLDLVAKNHISSIARKMGCSVAPVRKACALIQSLNPRPVNGFYEEENIKYILPDFMIWRKGNGLVIEAADRSQDFVGVSRLYLEMESLSPDDASYIREKTKEAEEVIRMLGNRKQTLQKVMETITERQKRFFMEGQKQLKPLSMKDVADQMGIHESTVSRAVSGKYFQCEWGVFPLKYLFVRGTAKDQASVDEIKERLRRLIDQEDKKKPWSDMKLQRLLTEEGYKISRRTVAKYRAQMNLKDASGRKNLS